MSKFRYQPFRDYVPGEREGVGCRMERSILFGVTVGVTARTFLQGQLKFLGEQGWEVHLTSTPDRDIDAFAMREGAQFHAVSVARAPKPFSDSVSLLRLFLLMRRLRPRLVVMGTPKMSLLGLLAAFGAGVPGRVYVVHGLRLEGCSGRQRHAYALLERLCCAVATHVVPVSQSLGDRLLELGLAPASKIRLVRYGSANGIDVARFPLVTERERDAARESLSIGDRDKVVLVLGRVTKDKGLRDLAVIWPRVLEAIPTAQLLLAGEYEPEGRQDQEAMQSLCSHRGVHVLGFVAHVRPLFAASDVLWMPTKREGLGYVALEAAVLGIPTCSYATTGTVDSVIPGATGTLVPAGDLEQMFDSLMAHLSDSEGTHYNRQAMRDLVATRFDQGAFHHEWLALLEQCLVDVEGAVLGRKVLAWPLFEFR